MLYHARRNAANYRVGRHIPGYHSSGSNHRIVAYRNALKYRCIRTYPHIAPQDYRSRISEAAIFGLKSMVERGKHHVVAYLTAVAKGYASMILKVAAGVDKHVFAYVYVLAEIGIERRKHSQRVGNGISHNL